MELIIESVGRRFSVLVDYLVTESDKYGETIVAASFGGNQTAVSAVAASIISGFSAKLTIEGMEISLKSRFGGYKKVTGHLNNRVHHCIVISKDAVFQSKSENPVVLAFDGNLSAAVGNFLSARCSLPREWEDQYYDILPDQNITGLNVYTDNPRFKNLKAVRLADIKEETFLELIGEKLRSGKLQIPPSEIEGEFDPEWTINQYLMVNAPILARQISEMGAHFVPGRDHVSKSIATMTRIPFPAQAYVIQGVVNYLKHKRDPIICGDMSTGKTCMSIGVAHVLHKEQNIKRVLISVPELVLKKWSKEIRITIPYANIRIIRSTMEALAYAREVKSGVKPKGLEIVLVGINRAKFGPEPWCGAIWKRLKGSTASTWHCPRCGRPLPHSSVLKKVQEKLKEGLKPEEVDNDLYAEWKDMVKAPATRPGNYEPGIKNFNNLPRGFIKKWNNESRLKSCPWCGEKLWRPASKRLGETRMGARWFVCKILKKLKKAFDLYICDEVHQAKASDSGRGFAFGQLVKSAKKSLCLTGTLTNGKSTSIRAILFRTNPAPLIKEGFTYETNDVKWIKEYGTLEKLVEKNKGDDFIDNGVITVRKGRATDRLVERPGISPRLVTNYLLGNTVFLELSDLDLPLVEIKERVVFLEMDEEYDFAHNYIEFHNNLEYACRKAMASGKGVSGWAVFNPATINYADQPHRGAYYEIGEEIVIAPETPKDFFHAKERWLANEVQMELEEDRGVIIYTNYTGKYGINERLQYVLEKHGIKSKILDTGTCAVDERIAWVEARAKEGCKVIITNKKLLEVGVDILEYPTAINYQMTYEVSTERQANRRNLRIGQLREVRIVYPVFNNTQQVNQLKRVMAGRGHAMLAEGRLDKSELAEFALDTHTSMTYSLAKCLADSDLADKWKKLASKDIDQKIKMVSEEKFKGELEAAKIRLTRETLRLCGVIAEEEPALEVEAVVSDLDEPSLFEGEDIAIENGIVIPYPGAKRHEDSNRWLHGLFGDYEDSTAQTTKHKKARQRKKTAQGKQPAEQVVLELFVVGA